MKIVLLLVILALFGCAYKPQPLKLIAPEKPVEEQKDKEFHGPIKSAYLKEKTSS